MLLGAKPEAPVDECGRRERAEEAERLAQRARVSEAGGQPLSAAFAFLGELMPQRPETEESAAVARQLREQLAGCLERDETGHPRLTVTLPDDSAFDNLVRSLAGLLGGR